MRFMIIVPSTPVIEQGGTGTQQQFADMQAYNCLLYTSPSPRD